MHRKENIIDILNSDKSFFESEFGIEKLAPFGSCARDESTSASDIDLLYTLKPNTKLSIFKYLKLVGYLEQKLAQKVDLVREETLKPDLRRYIRNDLIYVYHRTNK